jgi:hypothetical protein
MRCRRIEISFIKWLPHVEISLTTNISTSWCNASIPALAYRQEGNNYTLYDNKTGEKALFEIIGMALDVSLTKEACNAQATAFERSV